MTLDLTRELQQLAAAMNVPDIQADPSVGRSVQDAWQELTEMMAKVGRQQMRANQAVESVTGDLKAAAARNAEQLSHVAELAQAVRRERDALRAAAIEARRELLAIVDYQDDLLAMARQRGDAIWTERIERLVTRTLGTLSAVGLREIPADREPFDDRRHEAVSTEDRGDRQEHLIVEVIRRGFWYDDQVLRRSQVVVTR